MSFELDEALAKVLALTEQMQHERSERQVERDKYEARIAELSSQPAAVVERVRVEQVPVVEYRDKPVIVETPVVEYRDKIVTVEKVRVEYKDRPVMVEKQVIEYRDRIVEKIIEVQSPPKVVTVEKPVEVIRYIDRPVSVEVYNDKELKKRYDALCQEFNALQERLNARCD